jgi:phosphatidylserine/phosphatidylglycerophosphate/cardiolipin synthase-like enzyme
MLERAEAGVTVRGVFETTGSETQFSYYGDMQDTGLANVQVRQDGNPRVMHHKVIIIDRQTVVLGSFNFSASANDNNDENIVIVHDPTFTSFFVEEFNTVWSEARQE